MTEPAYKLAHGKKMKIIMSPRALEGLAKIYIDDDLIE